jgi:hypothetical protein
MQNKELEASEERKRKAKQLEMQRKELARTGRAIGQPRTPSYPTYTAPTPQTVPDTYDSYKAESKTRALPARGKGMQLGKKSKTTNAFEQIRDELGPEVELAPPPAAAALSPAGLSSSSVATPTVHSSDREPVHVTIAETISAKVSREGTLESFEVKGDLQLRITDPSLTQIKLTLAVGDSSKGVQLKSHPKVDKTLFKNQNVIQIARAGEGFPPNQSIAVMRWNFAPKGDSIDPPITFNVWVNDAGGNTWNITVEYEWGGGDALKDVVVSIPYSTSEPAVSSFDAAYEVSGDSIDWTIGAVDEDNPSGSFEFEAQASDEGEFFPMAIHFAKTKPFVDVDVSCTTPVICS